MRQNPHVRICGGPGSATTLVYPTTGGARARCVGAPASRRARGAGNRRYGAATRRTPSPAPRSREARVAIVGPRGLHRWRTCGRDAGRGRGHRLSGRIEEAEEATAEWFSPPRDRRSMGAGLNQGQGHPGDRRSQFPCARRSPPFRGAWTRRTVLPPVLGWRGRLDPPVPAPFGWELSFEEPRGRLPGGRLDHLGDLGEGVAVRQLPNPFFGRH